LLPITEGHSSENDSDDPEFANELNDRTSEWINYRIEINKRITNKNNDQALNTDAIEFVLQKPLSSPSFDTGDNAEHDLQADTNMLTHGKHKTTCPLLDQPTRQSAKIAERRARQNITRDGQTNVRTQDTRQPSLTSLDGILDQNSTVDQSDNSADKQISIKETNETQPNQDDQTANDI